ncbi:MAG: T9SS type A sorting domain-containing protein, partial [Candidatus Stahlbacteria bacterium]|nr:T9SS type A sorting domain-containing protein [Candidatus Stahlbacteria bacterium]
SYGNFSPNEEKSASPYQIAVASNAPDGQVVACSLVVQGNLAGKDTSWVSTFSLTIVGVRNLVISPDPLKFYYQLKGKSGALIDTIIYDDGNRNSEVQTSWWNGAVKFSVSEQCSVVSGLFYMRSSTSPNNTMYVYQDNGGVPGQKVDSVNFSVTSSWQWVNVPMSKRFIVNGNFWIGFKQTTSGSSYLGRDASGCGRTYYYSSGWTQITSYDMMIRAVVAYPPEATDSGRVWMKNTGSKAISVSNIGLKLNQPWIKDIAPTFFSNIGVGDSVSMLVSVDSTGLAQDITYSDTLLISSYKEFKVPVLLRKSTTPPSQITVTLPNGSEVWEVGQSKSITWTSENVSSNVKIRISRNGGSSWEVIFADTPNDGSEPWQVTGPVSSNCLIKVLSINDTTISDVSNSSFEIKQPAAVTVTIRDTTAGTGGQITIPILVSNVDIFNIMAFDISVGFDSNVIKGVEVINGAVIPTGWIVSSNIQNGLINISGATGTNKLVGEGSLVKIKFDVVAMTTDSTTFEFIELGFNDSIIPVITHCGWLRVYASYGISGKVAYFKNSAGIGGATISYTGGNDTTRASGEYSLRLPPGNYTITPGKVNVAQEGAISSFDAVQILRYNVGLITLDSMQRKAADVSGNTQIEAYDAALVLRYRVGMIQHFPVGDWAFMPQSKSYTPLDEDKLSEDYVGILYGDVDGSWDVKTVANNNVSVSLPEIRCQPGNECLLTVNISPIEELSAIDLDMEYNTEQVKLTKVEIKDGWLSSYKAENGILRLAVAGIHSMPDKIIKLHFKLADGLPIETKTIIHITKAVLNGGTITTTRDGVIEIASFEDAMTNIMPKELYLGQGRPNPSCKEVVIRYGLPIESEVQLKIYDTAGKLVKVLVEGNKKGGYYEVIWGGIDNLDRRTGAGIYFCKLKVGDKVLVNKLIYLEKRRVK